jgi:exodeoxyribonuclease VII large subunit
MEVLIYPVPVQGEGAAAKIADTIRLASRRREVDALLLTRGGGSLEDLWAFNEEAVARAIFDCGLPIVSAVGHEIDFTIADFVADQRAATPSAGAEALSPDGRLWLHRVDELANRLSRLMAGRLGNARERFHGLTRRLQAQHPGRRVRDRAQRVDELEQRLSAATRSRMQQLRVRLGHLQDRLQQQDPRLRIRRLDEQRRSLESRLSAAMRQVLGDRHHRLGGAARALEAVSPLATLSRGYAIALRESDGSVLRSATDVAAGERLLTRLHRGEVVCRVEGIRDEGEETVLTVPRGQDT